MPSEKLAELFDALVRPAFLRYQIVRSDGLLEAFDPLTLFSSLIESEIDLANATKLFDEIVPAIEAQYSARDSARDSQPLSHHDIHDIVSTVLLKHTHPHAPFWLSNYESMFNLEVDIEDDQSEFIDARNAGILRTEIRAFLEGKRDGIYADSGSLRDITNRIVKLIRYCGFYKVRRSFLPQFLDELSVSSAKAFLPSVANSEKMFSKKIAHVEQMLAAVPELPPEQHVNFCAAILTMLASAILAWLGVIHSSSNKDALKHVKMLLEDFYREKPKSPEASLLAIRGRLDKRFTVARLEPQIVTEAISSILAAFERRHVAEVLFHADKIIRYFKILLSENEMIRSLHEFQFGNDDSKYLRALAHSLESDALHLVGSGKGWIEVTISSRFHKLIEFGERLRVLVANVQSQHELDEFDFEPLIEEAEKESGLIFALVVQRDIGGKFRDNLRAAIGSARRLIVAIRRDQIERSVVRGEDVRTLIHREFYRIYPEAAEWQDTEIFRFVEPQLPKTLRAHETDLLRKALAAIGKGPETTPTLSTLRLLESRTAEHALLVLALARKLGASSLATVESFFPRDKQLTFGVCLVFLKELSRYDRAHLPDRVLELIPNPRVLREIEHLTAFRNTIMHNDLVIDSLKATDALHQTARSLAHLNELSARYSKLASDASSQMSYFHDAAGELRMKALAYWTEVEPSNIQPSKVQWRFGYVDLVGNGFNFLGLGKCTSCGSATRIFMGSPSNRYHCEACRNNTQSEGDWDRFISKLKVNTVVRPALVLGEVRESPRNHSGSAVSQESFSASHANIGANELYDEVIKTLEGMSLVMERSPKTFAKLSEEEIRHHFIVQLNGRRELDVTAEALNNAGKTDILVRASGRNLLVAECKIWRGERSFRDAVEQVLSYTTWRDARAAILLFNRGVGFTQVLKKVRVQLEKLPGLVGPVTFEADSKLQCELSRTTDPKRRVSLTVLGFDVPKTGVPK